MTQILLAILLSLPAWHGDVETAEHRAERLGVVAKAITAAAAGDRQLAILLVVQGEAETHYARHIHEGRCGQHPLSPTGECDAGRAVSPWQILQGPWLPRDEWVTLRGAGLGPTTRAARHAARALRHGRHACRRPSPLHGAFSAAARGSCRWAGAARRVARYRDLEARWWQVAKPP